MIFRATAAPSYRPAYIPAGARLYAEAENLILIQQLADRLIAKFRAQFLGGLDSIRTDILRQQLISALLNADLLGALESVQFPNFATTLSPIVEGMLAETMVKTVKAQGFGLRFDITNPRAVEFVQGRAAELVTRVTEETRLVLRNLIDRAFNEGIPPAKLARLIEQHIGLLPKHALAIENFRARLLADGNKQVDTLVERYSKKLLRYRATNIARTEIMTASNRGQDELWRQRAAAGLLDLSTAKRVWIATDPCPICAALDGVEVGFNETFPGGYEMPPAHPSCRCTLGLVT